MESIETVEAYGLSFAVPTGDTGVGACLRDYGEFARPEADLITAACDGDFLDVGANVGAICLPVAKAHPSSRVVAIEAHPALAELLERNVKTNQLANVSVIAAVAGDERGRVQIPAPPIDRTTNMGAFSLYGSTTTERVEAQMVRLDDIAPSATRFVKVDVEGFEARVLAGAQQLLRDVRPAWLVEVSPSRPNTAAKVRAALSSAGYRLYWFYSPFVTPKRTRGLNAAPPLRGDLSYFACDGEPPVPMKPVADSWPAKAAEFPHLKAYGFS